jgi:hypothetical protein
MYTSQKIYEVRAAREARAKRPYWVAYLVIFWVGVLTALSSRADNQVEQTCRAFGDIVYIAAVRRDEGWSKFELRSLVLNSKGSNTRETEISLELIETVFERPWANPESEANAFIKACIDTATYERTSVF